MSMVNVLIAESEELEFGYEVIGLGTLDEARDMAEADMAERQEKLEAGQDPGICPWVYKMYQRGMKGYSCVLEILAGEVTR